MNAFPFQSRYAWSICSQSKHRFEDFDPRCVQDRIWESNPVFIKIYLFFEICLRLHFENNELNNCEKVYDVGTVAMIEQVSCFTSSTFTQYTLHIVGENNSINLFSNELSISCLKWSMRSWRCSIFHAKWECVDERFTLRSLPSENTRLRATCEQSEADLQQW